MDATTSFQILWYGFCFFVVISFLFFSRSWLVLPNKWHVGMMSLSYSVLVFSCVADTADPWVMFCRGASMILGVVGIGYYWMEALD